MNPEIIRQIENEQLKKEITPFAVGDTAKMVAFERTSQFAVFPTA